MNSLGMPSGLQGILKHVLTSSGELFKQDIEFRRRRQKLAFTCREWKKILSLLFLLVTREMDVCLIHYKSLRRKKALYLDKITSACIKLKRASVKISNWPLNFIA